MAVWNCINTNIIVYEVNLVQASSLLTLNICLGGCPSMLIMCTFFSLWNMFIVIFCFLLLLFTKGEEGNDENCVLGKLLVGYFHSSSEGHVFFMVYRLLPMNLLP